MPKKSRPSVQKRQRESRKNERRIRKAERAAAKRDQPAETPVADSGMETPGNMPPSEDRLPGGGPPIAPEALPDGSVA